MALYDFFLKRISQRVPLIPLKDPLFGQRSASLVSSPHTWDHMAGRAVVHVTWLDLVKSTHLASAFDYSSLDQIIGACILLLYQLPDADKPTLVAPNATDWATATDRHRFKVCSSSQIRKDHEKGIPIHSNGTPGLDALTRPSAARSGEDAPSKMKCYLQDAVSSHPGSAAAGRTLPSVVSIRRPTTLSYWVDPAPGTSRAGRAWMNDCEDAPSQ